jgi:nitrate reductase delta subunit
MVNSPQRYDRLAVLLNYPDEGDFAAELGDCIAALEPSHPAAAEQLTPLRDRVRDMTLEEVQEMYTRTFDINPVCSLEVGWHIYGEDYARGALLVKMREQLREMNLPESVELPDHLTHVLALLGRLDGEAGDDFAGRYVLPALEKMIAGLQSPETPYLALLRAVEAVVKQDHPVEILPPRERKSDPPGLNNPLPIYGQQGCSEERKP